MYFSDYFYVDIYSYWKYIKCQQIPINCVCLRNIKWPYLFILMSGSEDILGAQQPMSVQTTITEHSDPGALLIKVKVCKNGMKNGLKIGKERCLMGLRKSRCYLHVWFLQNSGTQVRCPMRCKSPNTHIGLSISPGVGGNVNVWIEHVLLLNHDTSSTLESITLAVECGCHTTTSIISR